MKGWKKGVLPPVTLYLDEIRSFPEAPWVTLPALDQSLSGQTKITINLPSSNSTSRTVGGPQQNQDSVNKEEKS